MTACLRAIPDGGSSGEYRRTRTAAAIYGGVYRIRIPESYTGLAFHLGRQSDLYTGRLLGTMAVKESLP